MTKERIEIIRQTLIPFVKKELLKNNYEGLGKSDAKEFEKDLNEILDLAIKALDQPSGVEDLLKQVCEQERWLSAAGYNAYNVDIAFKSIYTSLTQYTPTQKWIPIITREPTEEEKKDYFEQNGEELCYMIDSPMPYNGQEVLVSGGGDVSEDVFDEDFWNFENWDIENVEAWMPKPKPYEKSEVVKND